ncbi:uncharacterized protein TRAVEDRAFT_42957 [Trametes versicolor FP-101664 SS1]|uniref:uncharacterized protein n=1 Tax=Trametes versicolor (strain FP-101664) TaxID=717944 RepID=UPI0004621B2F|nr:uncharacterized protein TRAVEDRAFT_42957 [Trametes versicolor FP-101664 SS1]EIW62606.1 hypothetical protein TRAVEDRAFT_42957 [Trametes versicolor FP-101664 SS1]
MSPFEVDPSQWPMFASKLTASIVALFLETLLFGTFAVTYTMGAWSLLKTLASRGRSSRDWVLLATSTTMFGLALVLTIAGFVANNSPTVFDVYSTLEGFEFRSPLWFARLGIYVTQTLIGDTFMIYRVFLVWNRSRKVIILPAILCLIHGVCGYVTLGGLLLSEPVFKSDRFLPVKIFTLLAFFCLSFTSNVLSSALIIWRVFRNANRYTPPSTRLKLYRMVVEAIVQSAAIYSMASLSLIITNVESIDVGFEVCLSLFPPLIGLVFSFIVLRMARSSAEDVARRLASHTRDWESDKPSCIITSHIRPTNVQLHTPPVPLPVSRLTTRELPTDAQTTYICNASTSSIKPADGDFEG